jgi:flavin reductase
MTEEPAPGNAHLATPIDSGRFREAMSRVAGAVHVVTTAGPAGLGGITASSVTSITLDPPMMLFCINTASPSAQRILDNRVFCINTLTAADQQLSDVFAGRTHQHLEERFTAGEWTKLATGAPVLNSALAAFDCRLVEAKEVSTHLIVMGIVEAVEIASGGEALLYAHRKYRSLMLD